jgi:ribosomal protein S27AE
MIATAQPNRCDLRPCPRCGTGMFLAKTTDEFGPLPEMRRYCCPAAWWNKSNHDGHLLPPIKVRRFG